MGTRALLKRKRCHFTDVNTGAVVKLTEKEPGEYVATQTGKSVLQPPYDGEGRYPIDWSSGPISVSLLHESNDPLGP